MSKTYVLSLPLILFTPHFVRPRCAHSASFSTASMPHLFAKRDSIRQCANKILTTSLQGSDENIGSSQETEAVSASRLLSTLAPVAVYAVIWLALFLILRRIFVRNYQARSVLNTLKESERSPQLPPGLFSWIAAFVKIPDSYVLTHHSLDGFLFLRLLKMAVISCFVGAAICIPILFPVNITGGGKQEQLDILNLSNVSGTYWRYFAHAGCAYLFFGMWCSSHRSLCRRRLTPCRLHHVHDNPREYLLHQPPPSLSHVSSLR